MNRVLGLAMGLSGARHAALLEWEGEKRVFRVIGVGGGLAAVLNGDVEIRIAEVPEESGASFSTSACGRIADEVRSRFAPGETAAATPIVLRIDGRPSGLLVLIHAPRIVCEELMHAEIAALGALVLEIRQGWRDEQRKTRAAVEQLRQAGRLSMLGESVSSVVHELNNTLTSVLGFTEMVRERLGAADRENVEAVSAILSETRRGTVLLQDILSFSRREAGSAEEFDVNELLGYVALLRRMPQREARIRLETSAAPVPALVCGSSAQLLQVLLNLVVNAEQAIGGERTDGHIELRARVEKDWVEIAVSDNGPGIPAAVEARIFEPYFTTKPSGKGSGLGLSISRTIVGENGGDLRLLSNTSKGAVFVVELPLSNPRGPAVELPGAPLPERGLPANESASPEARPCILVVDDELPILDVTAQVLARCNLNVTQARSGAEALQQLQSGDFDLVLSDFYMPGIDGLRLFDTLCELKPQYRGRFALMTGHSAAEEVEDFLKRTRVGCLAKPFTGVELRDFVRVRLPAQGGAKAGEVRQARER